jgi:Protein of unknown function (DUF3618)
VGQRADELRSEIEATREDMTRTLEAIGERINPKGVVKQRVERVRDGVSTGPVATMREYAPESLPSRLILAGLGTGAAALGVTAVTRLRSRSGSR